MAEIAPTLSEIDQRIAIVRENLNELVEQAAAYSGAADEALLEQRISDQQELLERLLLQRMELSAS
jgi:hypothetical protein